jgi:hypothetical protein
MSDTDARVWHPWLRINLVLCMMLHTRWSAGGLVYRRCRVKKGARAEE